MHKTFGKTSFRPVHRACSNFCFFCMCIISMALCKAVLLQLIIFIDSHFLGPLKSEPDLDCFFFLLPMLHSKQKSPKICICRNTFCVIKIGLYHYSDEIDHYKHVHSMRQCNAGPVTKITIKTPGGLKFLQMAVLHNTY